MTGAQRYAAERDRALRPGRRSAQDNVTGGPAALTLVAEWMTPCATPLPGGTCAAPMIEHELNRAGQRTWCSRGDGPRRCPCRRFTAP